jgi:hypothetical protein
MFPMAEKQAVRTRSRKSSKPAPAPSKEEGGGDDIEVVETDQIEIASAFTSAGEESVRRYIQYLADPGSLVDEGEAAEIERKIARSSDVLEKVRLHAMLTKVRTPDGSDVLADFLRDAKEWASTNGVPASAFASVGVTEDVLRRAGLIRTGKKAQRLGTKRNTSRVTVAEVQQWVMARNEPFTIRDVHESLGSSLVTSMKAIREMIDQGNVIELGQGENEGRRGRSPVRYLRLLE